MYFIFLFSQNRAMELTFTGYATGVSWRSSRFQMQILNVAKTTEHQQKFQITIAIILSLPICESRLLVHLRDLPTATIGGPSLVIIFYNETSSFFQNDKLILRVSSFLANIFENNTDKIQVDLCRKSGNGVQMESKYQE